MGEADLRLAEMKKLEYEFDRDIVRGAINPVSPVCVEYPDIGMVCYSPSPMQRTGNILGEKVIRYFEDRLRARVRCCALVLKLIMWSVYITTTFL